MGDRVFNLIKRLGKMGALDAAAIESLLTKKTEQDGGPGSGNFGHKGRPGKRGGSSKEGGGGSGGSSGKSAHSEAEKITSPKDLKGRELTIVGPGGGHKTVLRQSKENPNEFEAEYYSNFSSKPIMGSMNLGGLKNELKMADPERTAFKETSATNPVAQQESSYADKDRRCDEIHGELRRLGVTKYADGTWGDMKKGATKKPEAKKLMAEYKKLRGEQAAQRERWDYESEKEKGDSISENTKKEMDYARNVIMYGTRYDPESPKESRENVDFKKDLDWVNESKTRSEFIKRGEAALAKWDDYFKKDPYYSDGHYPPFQNALAPLQTCVESEKEDKERYDRIMKKFGGEGPNRESTSTMKEPPYGVGFPVEKHGSLKRDEKASDDMLKRFRAECKRQDTEESPNGTEKACRKFLDSMPVGAAFRFDEPTKKGNYDWMIKQKDGTFLYTNKLDGSQTVLTADVVAHDIGTFGEPDKALGQFSVSEKGASENDAFWTAKRQFANLEHNAGDDYTGKRVDRKESLDNCDRRAKGEIDYPKEQGNASREYTHIQTDANGVLISAGKPAGVLKKGSGVTGIDRGDLAQKNPDDRVYNTLGEHCVEDENGNLVLTPEREKLHQEIVSDIFKDAKKPTDGKKVATFLGGGSAAGKGTIQGSGFVDFPSKYDSPVIDADKIKESIPEYVDTAFSDDHEQAASYAHEESSSLAKRAIQAAMANGYNYTLDGTGDGSVKSMMKKIKQARDNGYEVNGVYVTCPTELAVERSIGRSKTDKYNRLVKPETVRQIHRDVSKIFPQIASEMDSCVLYDTNQGKEPVMIARCKRGQKIEVLNQKLYNDFLAKANE